MDISVETLQMAEDILTSIDANEEFMEHHGVKGQVHGVRRYQNEDGSLTALGRQHYGIGSWVRSRFSPAERGYRAAVKKKQQEQKNTVKKAKYAGNLKKMMKNRKYFTDQEIDQQIQTDTRRQQAINRLNDLSRADKLQRIAEKQAKQDRKDERRERKLQENLQKEAIKSQEKQHKLEQKTLLDIQKQKDKAQAEREQAQREYQTQQQIAKGKTFLGRLQKGAQMTAAIMGITSNIKKTSDALKALGFDTSKVEALKKAKDKVEEVKEATKNVVEKPPKNSEDKKQKTLNVDTSKWDANAKIEWKKAIIPNSKPTYELKKKYSSIITSNDLPDKQTAKSREKNYSEYQRLRLQEAAEDSGAQGFRERGYRLNGIQRRREREAEKEAKLAAQDRAEQIIENARAVKMKSTGPLSDTVKYVTSMSASKLASMLSGEVPISIPNKINLGSLMKTTIEQKPTYLEELRANTKIRHGDVDEEEIAGEIEDAE